jgi:hypothetical protein
VNREQVWDLLTGVQAYDQRTVGQGDVDAWHTVLHDVDAGLAAAAMVAHHRATDQRIKPFHVRDGARRIANERVERLDADGRAAREDARDRRLGIAQPDRQLGGLTIAADGDPVPGAYRVGGAVERKCEACRAPAGMPCVNVRTGERRRIPCPVRMTGRRDPIGRVPPG